MNYKIDLTTVDLNDPKINLLMNMASGLREENLTKKEKSLLQEIKI